MLRSVLLSESKQEVLASIVRHKYSPALLVSVYQHIHHAVFKQCILLISRHQVVQDGRILLLELCRSSHLVIDRPKQLIKSTSDRSYTTKQIDNMGLSSLLSSEQ